MKLETTDDLHVFLINLDRSRSRLQHMAKQASRLGLAFERVAAIEGANVPDWLRSEFDGRLKSLEEKLNEATNIPESKSELFSEADRQFKAKKYKNARKLWRTYESRYPDDPKLPEVRFSIGLSYFSERDYKSALGEFYKVIQEAQDASVVPDALYYSGLAFAKLGQCENAIAYFDALGQKKTKAPEEYKKKAKEQIDLLKKDSGEICLDKDKPAAPK